MANPDTLTLRTPSLGLPSGGRGRVEWQSAGPPPQIDFQGRQIENQAGLENAEA